MHLEQPFNQKQHPMHLLKKHVLTEPCGTKITQPANNEAAAPIGSITHYGHRKKSKHTMYPLCLASRLTKRKSRQSCIPYTEPKHIIKCIWTHMSFNSMQTIEGNNPTLRCTITTKTTLGLEDTESRPRLFLFGTLIKH